MGDEFFDLPSETQKSILVAATNQLNLSEMVLEKDIWICWLLKQLFSLPLQMAFKGGTSLSKVFSLINRFSEDVDITIDYRNFINPIDFNTISRSQLKKLSEQLKSQMKASIEYKIFPSLNRQISERFSKHNFKLCLNDDGEKLEFYYSSLFQSDFNYLRDHVLIEFGVRNTTEPSQSHEIKTLLSKAVQPTLILPTAMINTLQPERTFWEKATLIHVECHRNRLPVNPDRLSRHWYDLALLTYSWVGTSALEQQHILKDVIQHKKAFFNANYTHYDDCLTGKFRLIPNPDELRHLETDLKKMKEAGMFQTMPPSFETIIITLSEMENKINKLMIQEHEEFIV